MTTLSHEYVCGLDVPVDDAFTVRSVECVGDFDSEHQHCFKLQWTPGNQMLERDAVKKLHDDESFTTLLADVVNRADVRVVQSRGRLRFAPKACQGLGIAGDFFRQELECHEAMQTSVFGLINYTHPATAQTFDDAVVRDTLAKHGRNGMWLGRSSQRGRVCDSVGQLLQLRVLGFGLLQNGDVGVGVGVFPEC